LDRTGLPILSPEKFIVERGGGGPRKEEVYGKGWRGGGE